MAANHICCCPGLAQELVLLEKEKELLEKEQTVTVLREEVSGQQGWAARAGACVWIAFARGLRKRAG